MAHGAADRHRERLRVLDARARRWRRATRCRSRRRARPPTARSSARRSSCRGRAIARRVGRRRASRTRGRTARSTLVATARRRVGARSISTSAPEALLKGLLENVGGTRPRRRRDRIVDAILDWRDPDDLRRPNGAEDAGLPRGRLEAHARQRAVRDRRASSRACSASRPRIYARIAGSLTVHSRQAGINALTAPRDVLLALPNATAELVDAYLLRRDEALASRLPVPPFPPAQGFAAGAGAGLADPRPGGDARWCNLRPRSGGPASGRSAPALLALLWQEGEPRPLPSASAPRRGSLPTHRTETERRCPPIVTLPPCVRASRMRAAGRRAGLAGFLAVVAARARAAGAADAARRGRRAAAAAGARLRRRRPRRLWVPVTRGRGSSSWRSATHDRARGRCGGRRAAGRRSIRCGGARARRAGAPRVVIALPARQVLRKTITLPAAVEENLRQALGLRPRPPHAVQARRAVFRRGDRRARPRAQTTIARRSRRGAPRHRRSGAAARPKAGARTSSPSCPSRRGAPARRGSTFCRRGRAAAARVPGVAGSSGCRSRCSRRSCSSPLALPLWQKREYAIALRPPGRRGARAGRVSEGAAHRARAAHRRLQLRARAQVRVSAARCRSSTT